MYLLSQNFKNEKLLIDNDCGIIITPYELEISFPLQG